MKLEQITRNSPRVPSEKVYSIVDLKYMSSSVFYSGEANESMGPIRESIREDDHAPYGKHLNYEVWVDLKGSKEGRSVRLSNKHIPLNDD